MKVFENTNILLFNILILISRSPKIIDCDPTFSIDYVENQFLRDGQPFRYVSGSLHYFRVPSVLWRDRMLSYRAAGLNAIQTYVEWSSHEPERGLFDFTANNNLIGFLKLAQEVGLYVILRTGPYIDAERDMGGLPYWLLSVNPKMKIRTMDQSYIRELDRWYSTLLPKLVPMIYKNGGPVITVQIENEYGSYGCDFQYNAYLRDKMVGYFGANVVFFTTDGNGDNNLKCGKIDNVFATVDFGPGTNVTQAFAIQHTHQEFGPNVNSEYYPGWLDHWEQPHQVKDIDSVCLTLDQMLALNASVNIYVFHGGTSFGFGAGSNMDGTTFWPCPTSYDYDAPLNEAGDPTLKYFAMRKVIGKYMPLPAMPLPIPKPKMRITDIPMTLVSTLFDEIESQNPIHSLYPLTFEQLKHRNGFILYSTNITIRPSDPSLLTVNGLADRALVFVDQEYSGTLSRTRKSFQMPINVRKGSKLDILVENQGRVCFGSYITELKGITTNVTIGPNVLTHWDHYKIFEDWTTLVQNLSVSPRSHTINRNYVRGIPSFFAGQFTLPDRSNYPLDTFLRLDGWQKGLAFINGFNLGRYWSVGPQLTLYTPAHLFKPYPEINTIVVFETESCQCDHSKRCSIDFVEKHVINGTTPFTH